MFNVGGDCGVPLYGLWAGEVTGFRIFLVTRYPGEKRISPQIIFSDGTD